MRIQLIVAVGGRPGRVEGDPCGGGPPPELRSKGTVSSQDSPPGFGVLPCTPPSSSDLQCVIVMCGQRPLMPLLFISRLASGRLLFILFFLNLFSASKMFYLGSIPAESAPWRE